MMSTVHAVEIEEKIIEAAPLFSQVNYASYADADLDIVLDDARNYIATTDEKILRHRHRRDESEVQAQSLSLHPRVLRDHARRAHAETASPPPGCRSGGLSFDDLRILIATFDSVFPHTTAWYFTQFPTHFIILVGTPEPTRVDLGELKARMGQVDDDLRSLGVGNVHELASMLLLGENDIDQLVEGMPIHTDNRPILEYSDMALYNVEDVAPNLGRLIEFQQENLLAHFVGSERELDKLEEHFDLYMGHYRDYVRLYEQQRSRN